MGTAPFQQDEQVATLSSTFRPVRYGHGIIHRPLLLSNQRDYGQPKSTFDADAQL
jgi:hypothetical protein